MEKLFADTQRLYHLCITFSILLTKFQRHNRVHFFMKIAVFCPRERYPLSSCYILALTHNQDDVECEAYVRSVNI